MTGDLTVRDATGQVTFDVTAVLVDDATLEGTARAVISRDTFGLTIPSVPTVADVSDEVALGLAFTASAGSR